MSSKTTERIRCTSCRFVRPDKKASERRWMAYECGNDKSQYYKALLNITPTGGKQSRITWTGCELGEKRRRSL